MKNKSYAQMSMQMDHLGKAIAILAAEMDQMKKNIQTLHKAAHFHPGAPILGAAIESNLPDLPPTTLNPEWEKKIYVPAKEDENYHYNDPNDNSKLG